MYINRLTSLILCSPLYAASSKVFLLKKVDNNGNDPLVQPEVLRSAELCSTKNTCIVVSRFPRNGLSTVVGNNVYHC
jgi:hypothetical protein